ncbi:MAG: 4-(cytidine 5'-diphospho)-2-C-methyl-D-erythritol kinase [Alphaproteobacteria bacterium]
MARVESTSGRRFGETAPAKINLYLHVIGRRADGYHLLDSLVAFAGIGDSIEVCEAEDLSLVIDGPFAAALDASQPSNNLALRAARRLREQSGVRAGAAIRLHKALPVAAGIGGGSADAAATLRALCRLWELDAGDDDLMALALELGADVPVCLAGRAAFVGGIGEQLDFAPSLPPAYVLLVNPGEALATATVFGARRGAYSLPARFAGPAADAGALARLLAERGNDLEAAARRLAPTVGEALAALLAAPGCLLARMSGSGATCFGLFATGTEAAAAARRLADHPRWWVAAAPLVNDSTTLKAAI